MELGRETWLFDETGVFVGESAQPGGCSIQILPDGWTCKDQAYIRLGVSFLTGEELGLGIEPDRLAILE